MRQMKPLLKEPYEEEYTWSFTFDTKLTANPSQDGWGGAWWMTSGCNIGFDEASIPFYIPNDKISLTVNWGDGFTQKLNNTSSFFHTYANKYQVYTISVTSNQWSKIWLCGGDPGNAVWYIGGYGHHWYKHSSTLSKDKYYYGEYIYNSCDDDDIMASWCGFGDYGFCGSILSRVAAMRMGCCTILNPLPHVAGVIQCDPIYIDTNVYETINGASAEAWFENIPDGGTFLPKSMYYALGCYYALKSAPSNLFSKNLDAKDFTGCLWEVSSDVANSIQYPTNLASDIIETNNYIN